MKLYIYKDKNKEWRWRIKSKGRITADSGEGYKNKRSMIRALNTLRFGIPAVTDAITLSKG